MSPVLLLVTAAVRRFLPRPSARGCSATLRTIYDGANAWADFGNTNVLQTRYLYTRAMDEVLARLSSTSILAWDLPDILGSVRDISDGPGTAVIDHVKYDSYGNILIETTPASGDRFKYTAREWDAATSQYYYRARYYNSGAGRFTSQDPIGFAGGDVNTARYVGNTPVQTTDSTGLRPPFVPIPAAKPATTPGQKLPIRPGSVIVELLGSPPTTGVPTGVPTIRNRLYWSDVLDNLEKEQKGVKIAGDLILSGHGSGNGIGLRSTRPGGSTITNLLLTDISPSERTRLQTLLGPGSRLVLAGCMCGQNQAALRTVAADIGRPIVASSYYVYPSMKADDKWYEIGP